MAKSTFKDLRKFKSALDAERGNIIIGSRTGVKRLAEAVRDRAANVEAPRDTEDLAKGQEVRYRDNGQYAEVGAFKPKLYYHVFVHEGTESVEANPYLQRAAEAILPQGDGFIARDVAKAIGK